MKVLLIDNFDSFTFNIVHYLEQLDVSVDVVNNREVDLSKLHLYAALVLSPGPGLPNDAGKLMEAIQAAEELHLPILGVCLGMQALALYFGDQLYNQKVVKQGVAEQLQVLDNSDVLFDQLPSSFSVGLYHSWAVQLKQFSPLHATAVSESSVLMAVSHNAKPIFGVQFHPESILSENGLALFRNFVDYARNFSLKK